MSNLAVTLILVFILVFALMLIYMLRLTNKIQRLEEQCSNLALTFDNQQMSDVEQHQLIENIEQKFQAPILENEQVTDQLAVRTKNIQQKLAELEEAFEKLKHEQPEDKLYRRALKMVELGADIEEIMSECDIPQAEAELLFSIHINTQN